MIYNTPKFHKANILLCVIITLFTQCGSLCKYCFQRDIKAWHLRKQDPYRTQKDVESMYDGTYPFFYHYFKHKPLDRVEYFRHLVFTRPYWAFYQLESVLSSEIVGLISDDLIVLSQYQLKNNFENDQELVSTLVDTVNFVKDLDSCKQHLQKQLYRKILQDSLILAQKICFTYLEYIEYYVQNTPSNRILFVEKYGRKMPYEILLLCKMDLDAVFEVETPDFYCSCSRLRNKFIPENFEAALRTWKSKIQ